jgi:hypothetical protein
MKETKRGVQMNRRMLSVVAAVVGLTAICAPALAGATATAQRGPLIAFSRYRLSDNPVWKEIWVVKPDGRGLRRVVRAPNNYRDEDPTWSHDGSKLLFSRLAPLHGDIGARPEHRLVSQSRRQRAARAHAALQERDAHSIARLPAGRSGVILSR